MANTLNIPQSPPVDIRTGNWAPEWLQWIQSPSFLSLQTGTALGPTSGGTGSTAVPGVSAILVGNGTNYTIATTLPISAFPALTGDVTKPAGGTATTLATVNASVGGFGTGSQVASFVVNAKGLMTSATNTPITGAPGNFTVASQFGCNGKAAQAPVAVDAAIAGTAGVLYTATEQGLINSLLSLVNQLRGALVANGITV